MLPLNKINHTNFEEEALKVFKFQAENIAVYKNYLNTLKVKIADIKTITDIPFLPISFFKTHNIALKNKTDITFLSSGTTQKNRSKHHINDISIYEKSFTLGFNHFYGNYQDYCIQALLPSYLENEQSSLIYMINYFIKNSTHPSSGFVTEAELINNAEKLKNEKVLLIGVSYALLDLAEKTSIDLGNYIIMETGGMKGRRKEWTRDELHQVYNKSFKTKKIHSEYGMTELLSQAYSKGNGIFYTPPWMKILTRPFNEPFSQQQYGQTGVLKVIDLANINSCSFIETADLAKAYPNNSFEILGRIDFEDIRGCNLLIS